jgi:hypothetical protein
LRTPEGVEAPARIASRWIRNRPDAGQHAI